MSILCLICKEKLLSHSSGSFGSLNQLVENVLISTGCGHLYHHECLQSWILTQRRKLQIQGYSEREANICPSCQTSVKENDHRRIFPLEDHREALEKAKLLERQENLEIYCHQLEIQLQQLAKENDILLNKILTPPTSPFVSESYDTIVKNDRVVWMRPGESPVTGVVLSIFKKEGQLCAKIKLDRKIRTNQRTSRILSSFRLDKKQELTVPFDEIVLEKDVNQNVVSRTSKPVTPTLFPDGFGSSGGSDLGGKSYSSLNIPQCIPRTTGGESFRNSTLSLPGESNKGLFGIKESSDELMKTPSTISNSKPQKVQLNRSMSYSPGFSSSKGFISSSSITPESQSREVSSPQSMNDSNSSIDEQRDYVLITPSWMKNQLQAQAKSKPTQGRLSPSDGKNKHVTFADDPTSKPFIGDLKTMDKKSLFERSTSTEIESLSSENMTEINTQSIISVVMVDAVPKPRKKSTPPQPKPRPKLSLSESESAATINSKPVSPLSYSSQLQANRESVTSQNNNSNDRDNLMISPVSPNETLPVFQFSLFETITKINIPASVHDSIDSTGSADIIELLQDFDQSSTSTEANNSCFDVTLLSLLYKSIGFDSAMLIENPQDNDLSRKVKWIIRETFTVPLRRYGCVQANYSNSLKDSLVHLCSGELDVEELLTILFEFTFKMTPFINYSLAMCDYLHQFFIDFTDNTRIRTVQHLLEKSLSIQDNLKLEGRPNPAMILQMRHSDNGIIHYDAVIPNLTMSIDNLCEKGQWVTKKKCYCDNVATLECKTCTEIHGNSAVLFCENCKELLEGIHQGHDHELEISNVKVFNLPSTIWALSSIICFKDDQYTVFLKDGIETYSPWIYVHSIIGGKLQMKQLPGFGYWLESLVDKHASLKIDHIPPLLLKILKYSKVFIYLPEMSSNI